MYLVNGENKTHIDIADRGFQYGDGLFETIEVLNRQPVFLDLHLQRLQTGCQKLLIPCPDLAMLSSEALTLGRQSSATGRAVLKLIVTRGVGGRGYRQPDAITVTRVFSLHPYPDYPSGFSVDGVVARWCNTRLGLNPALAGIKHLNRLEQVLARAEWQDTAIHEGIMLDTAGRVIEGTMTNLFYVENATLYTAALSHTGIAGVMRRVIMMLAERNGLAVMEHDYYPDRLESADEIFLSNAIIGIWPVKRIATRTVPVGPVTRQLQGWLADHKLDTCCAA